MLDLIFGPRERADGGLRSLWLDVEDIEDVLTEATALITTHAERGAWKDLNFTTTFRVRDRVVAQSELAKLHTSDLNHLFVEHIGASGTEWGQSFGARLAIVCATAKVTTDWAPNPPPDESIFPELRALAIDGLYRRGRLAFNGTQALMFLPVLPVAMLILSLWVLMGAASLNIPLVLINVAAVLGAALLWVLWMSRARAWGAERANRFYFRQESRQKTAARRADRKRDILFLVLGILGTIVTTLLVDAIGVNAPS